LAASRLLEKHQRPVFVFGVRDGLGKGSARARKPFNLVRALEACAQHLLKFGGHEVAAGATCDLKALPAFREAFLKQAAVLTDDDRKVLLQADLELPLAEATEATLAQLAAFEPHGMKNPKPLFLARGLRLITGKRMGADNTHLRLNLGQAEAQAQAVAWRQGPKLEALQAAGMLDALYHLGLNEWNGRRTVQLEIKDIRPAGLPLAMD
jgi:single-stranded-DNA-specific exonuclease